MTGTLFKLFFLIIILYALPTTSEISEIKISAISTAISEVIKHFYNKKAIEFDLISYTSNSKLFDKVISKVTRNIRGAYQVFKLTPQKFRNFKFNQSAILLFESFQLFKTFVSNESILNNLTWKPLHFLVYYPNASARQVESLTNKVKAQFQSSLIDRNGDFDLVGVTFYSHGKCNKKEVVNINKYSRKLKKWATSDFFLQPLQNFHACNISFGVRDIRPYTSFYKVQGTEGYQFDGIAVHLMIANAQKLNFNLIFIPIENTGPSKRSKSEDLTLMIQQLHLRTSKNFFVTKTFYFSRLIVLVPSGEAYTSFEKLILPFDNEVWFWLIITFATAFVTILVVNFMPKFIQNFVFRTGVTTPMLNVWIVFCGLSFVTVPTRNFARFILMNFIIFSLIFRTAYQAKIFEFMQQDMNKKGVKTLSDIKERNWPLFCDPTYYYHYDGFKALEGIKVNQLNSYNESLEMIDLIIQNPTFVGGLILNQGETFYAAERYKGKFETRLLEETISEISHGLLMLRNHFLFAQTSETISRLSEGGVMQRWVKIAQNYTNRIVESGPQVLTFDHLEIGFQIWIGFLVVASIFFLAEKLRHQCEVLTSRPRLW